MEVWISKTLQLYTFYGFDPIDQTNIKYGLPFVRYTLIKMYTELVFSIRLIWLSTDEWKLSKNVFLKVKMSFISDKSTIDIKVVKINVNGVLRWKRIIILEKRMVPITNFQPQKNQSIDSQKKILCKIVPLKPNAIGNLTSNYYIFLISVAYATTSKLVLFYLCTIHYVCIDHKLLSNCNFKFLSLDLSLVSVYILV